jgi:hypothetical protein
MDGTLLYHHMSTSVGAGSWGEMEGAIYVGRRLLVGGNSGGIVMMMMIIMVPKGHRCSFFTDLRALPNRAGKTFFFLGMSAEVRRRTYEKNQLAS